MPRAPRAALVLVAVTLAAALGSCAGPATPADPAVVATWSEPRGIAADLVYVTDLDGFDLAAQSVGPMGDDGMSAMYVRSDASGIGTVLLTTGRAADPPAGPCADLAESPDPVLRCAVARGGAHVLLEGESVEAATLRAAAEAVRVPGEDELGALFAELPAPDAPVERGDLPPAGDGAPVDPPAAGG